MWASEWLRSSRKRTARAGSIIDRMLREDRDPGGSARADLGRLWRTYLRPFRGRLFLALVLTLIQSLAQYGLPLTWRFLIDDVLRIGNPAPGASPASQTQLLWVFIACNLCLWTLIAGCDWMHRWIVVSVGQRVVLTLRRHLHEKLQALHIGFYEQTPTGRVVSRVLDDVNVIRDWISTQAVPLLANITKIILGLGLLCYLSWQLTLIILLALPFYICSFAVLRPRIRRGHIAMRRLNARMYGRSAERIMGVRVIQAFTRERSEGLAFARLIYDGVRVGMRVTWFNQLVVFLAATITAVAAAAVIYLGMGQVQAGGMSLGGILAFVNAASRVFDSANQLTSQVIRIQAVVVVLRRVFALREREEEVVTGSIRLDGMKGKVGFENVTFTYPGHREPILRDISFRVNPGERVALMGPSGSGKSTVFQLLLRFYDPLRGAVRVGGVDLVDADLASVRRHVCMVQQEPVVFSGTIGDNITYGRLDAPPSRIMEAATQAEFHDFAMSLPLKYETEVGEDGISLSGGQKQRLALATALLTNPEVLLLDDTTSALDADTEARIRATLNRVLKGRTSFIITQRIATARDCDRIIVIEKGRITQRGTPAELAAQEGFYRRIFRQQESA